MVGYGKFARTSVPRLALPCEVSIRVIFSIIIFFNVLSIRENGGKHIVKGASMVAEGHLLSGTVDPTSMPSSSLSGGKPGMQTGPSSDENYT